MLRVILGAVLVGAALYALVRFDYLDYSITLDPDAAPAAGAASDQIGNPEAIHAHLNFLADDYLEGREAGSRSYEIAARYAASYFEGLGLAPAGDDGSYLQSVPLREIRSDADAAVMIIERDGAREELATRQDFSIGVNALYTDSTVTAPVIFAGFGIEAPEFGIDSYAGLDVEGKYVAVFIGGPDSMPGEERAHYGSGATKGALAQSKGAVGMINLYTPAFEGIFPFERVIELSDRSSMTWIGADGVPHSPAPELRAGALMNPASTQRLFEGASQSYEDVRQAAEQGEVTGFDLDVTVTISQRTLHNDLTSPNVVALLEGSDPQLKDEYVVFTAHLDHDGYGPEVDGDNLYNGAVDNASGSAVVLDVARAFAQSGERPRRSILFTLVTAEEKGLRGAGYFAHHPPVPIENIVANVNIDGGLFWFDFADIIAFGETHSTLGDHVRLVTGQMGLSVTPDPAPEQGFFTRSDHYRFVQQGVPAVFTLVGFKDTDGGDTGAQVFNSYLAENYHKPSDDMSLPFDYEAGAKFVKFQYLLGQSVANADERPQWHESDFFGDLYGRE